MLSNESYYCVKNEILCRLHLPETRNLTLFRSFEILVSKFETFSIPVQYIYSSLNTVQL
jgi:hypothetical protein